MITHDVSYSAAEIRARIRAAILAVEPEAEIILFGSRARGTARPDSDWDILALLPGDVTDERKRAVRHALYEVEFEVGEALVSIIKSKSLWYHDALTQVTSLYQNVQEEGVAL